MQKNRRTQHVIIGLTGQTGAGKTTVSTILTQRGFCVIDADFVARQVVQKGNQCLIELVFQFGIGILDADGNLNRQKLGGIVFSDPEKRMMLNRITFPHIQAEIERQMQLRLQEGHTVIFLDAPTLFESNSDRFCHRIVSVIAAEHLRFSRILSRDNLTEQEAKDRMHAQHADAFYTMRSDFVIQNDDDSAHLYTQVLHMLEVCCGTVERPDQDLLDKGCGADFRAE